MSQPNKYTAINFFLAGILILMTGGVIGYYITDIHAPKSSPDQSAQQTPLPTAPMNDTSPQVAKNDADADYTAPGAPKIVIKEEMPKPPPVKSAAADPATISDPNDSEASQEDPPPTTASSPDMDASSTTSSDNGDTQSTSDSGDSATSDPKTANGTGSSDAAGPDADNTSTNSNPDGEHPNAAPSKARYRVQIGPLPLIRSARTLATALQNRGYSASVRAQSDDGKMVYNIQTGAYRYRESADKAAQDLQRSGYPASVVPIVP